MNTPLPYTAASFSCFYCIATEAPIICLCFFAYSSSSMWVYYSVQTNDIPMISRSSYIAVHFGGVYHPEWKSSKCCHHKGTTYKGTTGIKL